jgi:hypothetical protein
MLFLLSLLIHLFAVKDMCSRRRTENFSGSKVVEGHPFAILYKLDYCTNTCTLESTKFHTDATQTSIQMKNRANLKPNEK